MLNDYYETLELSRECSQEEISEAYRRLSLKYHPKNCSNENVAIHESLFQKIAEAYEVLSDPNKKGIYDIFGKDGLSNGVIDKKGNLSIQYKYKGNGHEIFEKFIGTSNPFALLKDPSTKPSNDPSTPSKPIQQEYHSKKQEIPPIIIELECTLEELYKGVVKTVKYKREILNRDMRTTTLTDCIIEVEVQPGYDKSTIIKFKAQGNESPGLEVGDLHIKIVEIQGENYKRVNSKDLVYIKRISLSQALNHEVVKIETLDNRCLVISMDEIISPQSVKVIKGEGMPIYEEEKDVNDLSVKKGDLYIKFDIKFPDYINPVKKERIIQLLKSEDDN